MKNQTAAITRNSLWGTVSYLISSGINIALSIEITRYFGKELFGQYSYFIWLTAVLSLLAGLGMNQGITKYLPRYFPARLLVKKFLRIEIVAGIIVSLLLLAAIPFISRYTPFQADLKTKFFLVAIGCILPVALNALFTSILSALQQFKKLSIIQMVAGIINLTTTTIFVITKQDLTSFLWLFLGLNIATCLTYLGITFHLFREKTSSSPDANLPHSKEPVDKQSWREIFIYNFWNYLGVIFGQITWERSEFFFLGIYGGGSQIAIYSLAYSLSILFIGLFGPLTTVLTNVTAKAVGNSHLSTQQAELKNICEHASKYMAMVMLPSVTYATFFIGNLIALFYGKTYVQAALFFPFLVLSHVIALIITPASNIAYFKNEARRMTFITMAIGIINITLDIILIPRFQLAGAVAANTISQAISITIILINARKYRLNIFNPSMLKVFSINIIFGLLLLGSPSLDGAIAIKLPLAIIAAPIYIILIMKFAFKKADAGILQNLLHILPKKFQPLGKFLLSKIRFS